MKKLFLYTFASIGLLLTSCDINDENEGKFGGAPESGWIEFNSASSTVAASVETAKIPVTQQTVTNTDGTIITYSVSGTSGDIPDGVNGIYTTEIEEGQFNGFLEVPVKETTSTYTLEVEITNVSKSNILLGLEDENGNHLKVHTLIVCDGTIVTSYNGTTYLDGSVTNTFNATLTPVSGEDKTYSIDTAWGDFVAAATGDPSQVGQFPYDGTLVINEDNSVTITGADSSYATGGEGTYDPCTKTFDLVLTQDLFTTPLTPNVVLVGQ